MKIKATIVHISTPLRMGPIAATLARHGHLFTNQNISDADIWLVDCMHPHKISDQTIEELIAFRGQIILMSLGDWSSFNTRMEGRGLPDEVIDKAAAFAKIQWTHDDSDYDRRIIGKQIIMQPFLIGGLKKPSSNKKPIVSFYGLPTGDLDTEKNLRIKACNILKSQPWFHGGIVGQEPGADRCISGVEVGHRPRYFYLNSINNSLLSLCMPGNSVLTYRHFESMGMQSCIVSCCLDKFKWLNRMIPNEHYLDVLPDLSNLMEICERAILDEQATLRIAKNGYNLYEEYYQLLPDGGMTEAMWNDITKQLKEVGVSI